MTVTLLRADARALPLADASVDLIVTSPPYWALRSYTDGGEHYAGQIGAEPDPATYVDSLIECTREWVRVLKPTGSLWVNLGDKYAADPRGPRGESSRLTNGPQHRVVAGAVKAAGLRPRGSAAAGVPKKSLIGLPWRYALRCVDDMGLTLRAEVIWSKPNGLPESVGDRVRRSHETWFHLTKQPRYFAAVDAIREPVSDFARPRNAVRTTPPPPGNRPRAMADTVNPLGRLPGSVREVATQPLAIPAGIGVDHFAAFPMEWPRWIIRGWSPACGTVLDPFGGTGTAALVADALGRHGISVDMSADYCRLAAWRTRDPGQRAAALGVPRPPRQADGQLDLLAGAP